MDLTDRVENHQNKTIIKLVNRDKVNDEFRRKYLKNKLWSSLGLSGGCLAIAGGAAYIIDTSRFPITLFPFNREVRHWSPELTIINISLVALGLAGLYHGVKAIPKLFKAVKTSRAYNDKEKNNKSYVDEKSNVI